MELLTWGEIKGKIQRKHGIETDESYDEQELLDIANEAIDKIESKIISLQQDYFLSRENIAVTSGVTEYSLPRSMYASKIRRVYYKDNTMAEKCKIYRAKDLDEMEEGSEKYRDLKYILLNTSGQRKLLINRALNDATLTVYFTRNANKLTLAGGDSQLCDIPEFASAVMKWMSYLIEWKDKSPTTQLTQQEYKEFENDLVNSLSVSVNDEDHSIEPDTDIWDEHA